MSLNKITYLICYDAHRSFTEDVRKRFSDSLKYSVESFHSLDQFEDHFRSIAEKKINKIALILIPDSLDNYEAMIKLTSAINNSDPYTGIILIVPPDKMEEIRKAVNFNIDAFIPKNVNSILRIHNVVKKLISEYNIYLNRKRRNVWLYILISFLIICGLGVLFAYIRFPEYF